MKKIILGLLLLVPSILMASDLEGYIALIGQDRIPSDFRKIAPDVYSNRDGSILLQTKGVSYKVVYKVIFTVSFKTEVEANKAASMYIKVLEGTGWEFQKRQKPFLLYYKSLPHRYGCTTAAVADVRINKGLYTTDVIIYCPAIMENWK